MEPIVVRYLYSRGAGPAYVLEVQHVMSGNPALQSATNGFCNAREAARHMQSALVHLLLARKNGEMDEVAELQSSIDCSITLIDELTDAASSSRLSAQLGRAADSANMAARFQRIWRAVDTQSVRFERVGHE